MSLPVNRGPGVTVLMYNRTISPIFTEEKKRLQRSFDERHGEAEEVVGCYSSSKCVFSSSLVVQMDTFTESLFVDF